ncbi:MAG: hypothetical protein V5B60_18780 [Accumulibacter sp.]|jgi:hypothetical protein|uniref:hypothetical protein n=1 Tax=Accumulibacter sp. TaxID=2053492 RepID=UPI002FC2F3AD
MSKDFDYFLAHPEEFEQLSAEDQAKLAEGQSIEGEISSVPPDAAAEDETNPEQQQVDPAEASSDPPEAPVVLAKDGKHTIPFEELQAAREQARYWQARAEEALVQRQAETPMEPATTPPVDLKELRRELREAVFADNETLEAEIQEKIDAELTRRAEEAAYQRIERRDAEARQRAAEQAVEAAAAKAIADYPFLDHTGQQANHEAIAQVQALSALYANNGSPPDKALADAVAKVVKMYVDPPPPKPDASGAGDIEAKAAAAIAKARSPAPNSMSAIPSASVPHHDEAEAMLNMSPAQLSAKFSKMTPDQIEAAVSRIL